tara:strand:+ start:1408 stop:2082 length:675 start_codon:yes stop_codon:yes gene_type:complete
MERCSLAIVIPAFNEEKTIFKVVRYALNYGTVLVINDASFDRTKEEAEKAGAILLSNSKNLGYDSSLEKGFEYASRNNFSYIMTMDADGQHNEDSIRKVIDAFEDNVDLVTTTRQKKQRFGEFIFGLYFKSFIGLKDPLSGLKAYRTNLYKKQGYFDSYKSIGTELLIYAIKNKYKIKEIKISNEQRSDQPRFGSFFKSNLKILRAFIIALIKLKFQKKKISKI